VRSAKGTGGTNDAFHTAVAGKDLLTKNKGRASAQFPLHEEERKEKTLALRAMGGSTWWENSEKLRGDEGRERSRSEESSLRNVNITCRWKNVSAKRCSENVINLQTS